MGKINKKNTDEHVITPGGIRAKSDVHLIENGFHVKLDNGMLLKVNTETNNIVKELGKLNKDKSDSLINPIDKNSLLTDNFDLVTTPANGWIIYSGWQNETGNPITHFSTKWVVPEPPTSNNGQLIYLFNGIENSVKELILQPVLQWGVSPAGGGNYWAIANWLVGMPETGIALHGPLILVNPGDVLQGVMSLKSRAGNKYSYLSSFVGRPECDLLVNNIEELTYAVETLECYGLRQFSDYPNSFLTAMSDIEIRQGVSQAQIQWEENNVVTDNGQHCTVISNASPNGCVNLCYK